MDVQSVVLIGMVLSIVATLYSSVGHGGASGYIAILALFGLAPEFIRPAALSLNVAVAGLATIRFARAGFVDWRAVLPIVCLSVPFAFIGGTIVLEISIYRFLLGVLLILSSAYLVWQTAGRSDAYDSMSNPVPMPASMAAGSVIGFVSGLSGIGGGVLLSPTFLILGWSGARQTAGIAAVFIVANSLAGLAGNLVAVRALPLEVVVWVALAFVGSHIGSSLGTSRLPVKPLVWLLSAAILISGLKFIWL